MLYRHGDVAIIPVKSFNTEEAVPETFEGDDVILAYGEVTGHAHRVVDKTAKMFNVGGKRYLVIENESSALTHEEHARIDLPRGVYEVRVQVEYTPTEIRRVAD